jgi:UDP-N-acetylmuramoylalanine-D-glutamate ligase
MSKLRFYAAMLMAKTMYLGLKLLGRNASYLPGKVAVKLCKDFLAHLQMPKTVVCVTGTNGKTTVSNMLTKILRECGYDVTNNALGSNVQAGVATALLENADLLGRTKKEIAVLEVDERSSLLVYPYIKPDYILCNNIMRDSVKRNAHTDFISFIINKGIPADTKLVLNADDTICAHLGLDNPDRTYFGISAQVPEETVVPFLRMIRIAWTAQEQIANQKDIIATAETILARVSDFCAAHAKMGKKLEEAMDQYEACDKKIRERGQSIVGAANKLIALGVPSNAKKILPAEIGMEEIA